MCDCVSVCTCVSFGVCACAGSALQLVCICLCFLTSTYCVFVCVCVCLREVSVKLTGCVLWQGHTGNTAGKRWTDGLMEGRSSGGSWRESGCMTSPVEGKTLKDARSQQSAAATEERCRVVLY